MSTIGTATATPIRPTTTPVAASMPTPSEQSDADTSGGGALGDILKTGIGKLVSFASKGMQSISDALNGEISATGGGSVDPAKVQGYVMQMNNYDTIMRMAAKLQEHQDEAIKAWLR
ncbi:MAG: hypothetical protein KDC46_00345 [Thermoleophilia bacterium]|nr:hypothetical protein [Thermoleophilia bacterium]